MSRSLPVLAAVLALVLSPGPAGAQLRLRGLGGALDPALRLPGQALGTRPDGPALDPVLAPVDLAASRLAQVAERARAHRRELDRDPRGELVVRAELLAAPSTDAARDALRSAGFTLLREETMDGLDLRWLVLRPPAGQALADALERARALDPGGLYDYHHVYLPGGCVGAVAAAPAALAGAAGAAGPEAATAAGAAGGASAMGADGAAGAGAAGAAIAANAARAAAAASAAPAGEAGAVRVGLVDSGIDAAHPVLRGATLRRFGCDGEAHPAPHGTAVASLLVGRGEGFASAAPGAELYAADAFCDAPTGGSVEAVAQALAWLVRERVPVVNVSLVGPPNLILQRVVAAAVRQGMMVVAAVGNDGPAAPPLYPASWPGVVGVGAVDGRGRLLPEDARGPQVMFVAPGADMVAAAAGERRFVAVRGTSFAAPLVAGLLAGLRAAAPDARTALERLAARAHPPAGDPPAGGYGRGLVGEALATAPGAVPLVRER